LQAAVLQQEENTVWTIAVLVRVFNPLAQKHAHMIHSVPPLAANQDIASILFLVLMTKETKQL